jgi:hypothetical protein
MIGVPQLSCNVTRVSGPRLPGQSLAVQCENGKWQSLCYHPLVEAKLERLRSVSAQKKAWPQRERQLGTPLNITKIYAARVSYLSILFLPRGTGMEGAMVNAASNDEPEKNELSELSCRIRGVAEALKSLSGDQAGFRERLEELKDELNSLGSRLRNYS